MKKIIGAYINAQRIRTYSPKSVKKELRKLIGFTRKQKTKFNPNPKVIKINKGNKGEKSSQYLASDGGDLKEVAAHVAGLLQLLGYPRLTGRAVVHDGLGTRRGGKLHGEYYRC